MAEVWLVGYGGLDGWEVQEVFTSEEKALQHIKDQGAIWVNDGIECEFWYLPKDVNEHNPLWWGTDHLFIFSKEVK